MFVWLSRTVFYCAARYIIDGRDPTQRENTLRRRGERRKGVNNERARADCSTPASSLSCCVVGAATVYIERDRRRTSPKVGQRKHLHGHRETTRVLSANINASTRIRRGFFLTVVVHFGRFLNERWPVRTIYTVHGVVGLRHESLSSRPPKSQMCRLEELQTLFPIRTQLS